MRNITFRGKFGQEEVVRTPQTDVEIEKLDKYLDNCPVTITSVLRNPARQYKIIYDYAVKHKIQIVDNGIVTNIWEVAYESIFNSTNYEGKQVPIWQLVWSLLLGLEIGKEKKGLLIAPPVKAQVLTGIRKGLWRYPSKHFTGQAFDLDCKNLQEAYNRIKAAINIDTELRITKVLIETLQNCIHCEI